MDTKIYTAVCAAVRKTDTREAVTAWAKRQVEEWAQLGYRRTAKIYYRDGSLVSVIESQAA